MQILSHKSIFLATCMIFIKQTGFTLIELLVVIAIIGTLSIAALNLDFTKILSVQKEDRFTGWVTALIRSEINRTVAGRGIPKTVGSTELVFPTETRIILSSESIRTEYLSGSTVVSTGEVLNKPFFGEALYVVGSLSGTLVGGSPLGEVATQSNEAIILSLATGRDIQMSYSGAWISGCPSGGCSLMRASINLGNAARIKTLTIDRRSGVIEVQ
jgi:prepilin-type N-terminal cleavage/methylation domain-containing protein